MEKSIFSVVEAKRLASVKPSRLPISELITKEDINGSIQDVSKTKQVALAISFEDDGGDVFTPALVGVGLIKFHNKFSFYDDGTFIPMLCEYQDAGYDVNVIYSQNDDGTVKEISDFIISWDTNPIIPTTDNGYFCENIRYFTPVAEAGRKLSGMVSNMMGTTIDNGEWS